jgi:hypothetical protein
MPTERLAMRKIKEILRLKYGLGLSVRQIARSCSMSHSGVYNNLRRAQVAHLSWPHPEDLDDAAIEARLFPSEANTPAVGPTLPDGPAAAGGLLPAMPLPHRPIVVWPYAFEDLFFGANDSAGWIISESAPEYWPRHPNRVSYYTSLHRS